MDCDSILDELKAKGVIRLKHAFNAGKLQGNILGGIVAGISTTMKPNRGTDHRTTLTLLEPSTVRSQSSVAIFHSGSVEPSRMKKGDIFLSQGVKANMQFNNFTSNKMSRWAGFDTDTFEKTCEGDTGLECDDTIKEILGLYHTWQKTAPPLSPPLLPSTNQVGRPLSKMGTARRMIVTTENMTPMTFIDYVGMVENCYKSNQSTPVTYLRLTDYTPNRKPINLTYTEKNSILVPSDTLINCALFDENSINCPDDLRFGDYVYIKNATCKLDPNGSIELAVRHDKYTSSVKLWRLDDTDPLVSEILRLRQSYEASHKRQPDELSMPLAKKPKLYKISTVLEEIPKTYSFVKDIVLDDYETNHHLRVCIIDYKPKTIADISVKLCDACGETSPIDATQCRKCGKTVGKVIYRCLLQFKDAHGDILMAAIYGTDEEPIFDKIPVVNLKENKDVCDQVADYMHALCPLDKEKGPMLNMCVKAFVYDNCLRCVIQNTKYQIELE